MRILKNRILEARWNELAWERTLSTLTLQVRAPRLAALVSGSVDAVLGSGAVDVGALAGPEADGDTVLLLAIKAAFALAVRLEEQGAFRVLVRRHEERAGEVNVTLRCLRRDDSHPRTPEDLDPGGADCVLFVDTRRIDGARRP
jgi:hypothetical protein